MKPKTEHLCAKLLQGKAAYADVGAQAPAHVLLPRHARPFPFHETSTRNDVFESPSPASSVGHFDCRVYRGNDCYLVHSVLDTISRPTASTRIERDVPLEIILALIADKSGHCRCRYPAKGMSHGCLLRNPNGYWGIRVGWRAVG